jgi:hypothetical protein
MDNDQNQNPFEAAIAALEARRTLVNAEIDADIAKLREIAERSASAGVVLSARASIGMSAQVIAKDTFYNMTLPEAAKKYLAMSNKKPQSTNAIIDVLAKGGLKRTTYGSMYASLSRRENNVGDIVNVNGDWGLPEWYGAKAKPKRKPGESLPSADLEGLDAEVAEVEASTEEKTA